MYLGAHLNEVLFFVFSEVRFSQRKRFSACLQKIVWIRLKVQKPFSWSSRKRFRLAYLACSGIPDTDILLQWHAIWSVKIAYNSKSPRTLIISQNTIRDYLEDCEVTWTKSPAEIALIAQYNKYVCPTICEHSLVFIWQLSFFNRFLVILWIIFFFIVLCYYCCCCFGCCFLFSCLFLEIVNTLELNIFA